MSSAAKSFAGIPELKNSGRVLSGFFIAHAQKEETKNLEI